MMSLAGPNSRALLAKLSGEDLSNAAFPFATTREIELGTALVQSWSRLKNATFHIDQRPGSQVVGIYQKSDFSVGVTGSTGYYYVDDFSNYVSTNGPASEMRMRRQGVSSS